MTAPRAQEPLTAELIAGMISTLDFTPSSRHPEECLPLARRIMAEARRAQSADTRRLLDLIDRGTNALWDSINASGNDASTNAAIVRRMRREAGLDAAMTQEGEAKQARESDRWLADGPDLNEEGDA